MMNPVGNRYIVEMGIINELSIRMMKKEKI